MHLLSLFLEFIGILDEQLDISTRQYINATGVWDGQALRQAGGKHDEGRGRPVRLFAL